MGRKAKPTKLKLLQGNPGKRPINESEPNANPASVRSPTWLSDGARKCWDMNAATMIGAGVLTKLDADMFSAYCESFSLWQRAHEQLEGSSLIHENESGYKQQNGLIGIINKSQDQLVKLAREFGMTPSARTNIRLTVENDDNEWNDFD
ncbi:MAG TPA: phage terminase small subunit P27 family [Thiotrichaceae bacterium]|nr:phage terminase small subunit P27 family [Thiotrichaceae bacterium]